MDKLTPKKIIEFRGLSERRIRSFIDELLTDNPADEEKEKRHYWQACLTAIGSACKQSKVALIRERIDKLLTRKAAKTLKRTIQQYQRNIAALHNFEEYDFSKIKPDQITFQTSPREKAILTVKGLPVKVAPSYVFSFNEGGSKQIGAIWFVADKDGLRSDEFGIFLELMHRYLYANYGKTHTVNPEYCRVVEVFTGREMKYSDVNPDEISALLDKLVDAIKAAIRKAAK